MKKQKTGIPRAEATAEDVERLVAGYSKALSPERQAEVLDKLKAARHLADAEMNRAATKPPHHEKGRE